MKNGRELQPGDLALTDFNGRGLTQVRILLRKEDRACQSGILFQVHPPLKNTAALDWIDADWFWKEPEPLL
jgi:hypothetical protein